VPAVTFAVTVDTGGTFTDLILADSLRILGLYKAPTTPDDPFDGVRRAIDLAAEGRGMSTGELLARTRSFVYATTTATNAMLEGRTARTALLTTAGHRDILLYREGGKSDPLNISVAYPEPYVPRSLTFGVGERILSDGTVLTPLDEDRLVATLRRLGELKIEAVGVCLLWSIVNPVHEKRVGELLQVWLPDVEVTLSHVINPIIREYRRASATVIDASLKPLMRTHLHDVDRRLREMGFRGEPLLATHLSGGVLPLHEMCEQPLHSVDSGPALAPIAGLAYTAAEPAADDLDVLVVDAGGTSLDICPTRDRRVLYTREKWCGPKWRGHMTGLPAVETRSVGAGGGSIAQVDSGGLLTVGPRSAGAVPGPACYARGGSDATVTDAAVVLGYVDPDYFLGGRLQLDAELSSDAVERGVARPLGITVEAAAAAILAVFSETMRSFISEMTITQGLDPRRCLVVSGGGASGLNIVMVARELGVTQVLVPTVAAGLSAVGGQYADIVATFSRALRTSTPSFDFDAVNAALAALAASMNEFVGRMGGDGPVRREFFTEARYANQLWELDLSIGDKDRFEGIDDVRRLSQAFDELHRSVFAVNQPGEAVESITWRGDVRIARAAPTLPTRQPESHAGRGAIRPETRTAWFGGEPHDTPVMMADRLRVGTVVKGPAIIEEPTTTIVLIPGSAAHVRPGHYLVDVGA
jgi:N-methylhydantoinase A